MSPSTYQQFQYKNIDVLQVNAAHFQTTQITLRFFTPLKKPDNTAFRLMLGMMNQKNVKYPTKKAWKAELQNRYNMRLGALASHLKDRHVSEFKMTLIDPSLVDETPDYFFDAMNELLNYPLFDDVALTFEKQSLKDEFLTKKASKSYRAARLLTCHLFKDHPYFVRTMGDEEQIDLVTLDMIKNAYHTMINAPALLVVVGPLEKNHIQTLIDTLKCHPKERLQKPAQLRISIPELTLPSHPNDMKQMLVYHVFETHIFPEDDAHLALDILSYMLGGDSESLLFKTIRETHSMAYSVHTISLDQYGVLLIQGAIDPSKHASYHEEIMAMMSAIKNGQFDESVLALSIQNRVEEIKRNTDHKSALASRALNHYFEQWPFDVNALIQPFSTIGKHEIIEVARQLTYKGSFKFGAVDEK